MRIQRLTNTLGLLWSNSVQLTQKIVQIPRFILGCVLWTAMGLGLVECSSNYIEQNQSNLAYEWLQSEGFEVSEVCAPLRGLFVQGSDGIRETWHKDAAFLFPSASTYTSQAQLLPLASEQNALYADSKMYAEPKLYVESKVYVESEVNVEPKTLHSTAESSYAEQNASTISSLPLLTNSIDLSSEQDQAKSSNELSGANLKSESERKSLTLRERFAFFDKPPLSISDLQSAKTHFSQINKISTNFDSAHMHSIQAENQYPQKSYINSNLAPVSIPVLSDKQVDGSDKHKARTDDPVFGNGKQVTNTNNQIVEHAGHVTNINNQEVISDRQVTNVQKQLSSVKSALNYSPQQSLAILNQVKSQLCQQGICEQDYASSPDEYARLLGQALVHWSKSRKM